MKTSILPPADKLATLGRITALQWGKTIIKQILGFKLTTLAHRHARQAIGLALIAYAMYSTGDMLAKWLGAFYTPAPMLVFNGLFLCLISTLWLRRTHPLAALWQTPRLGLHLFRSLIVGVLSLMAMTALNLIPLSDFYGIVFMSPFLVVILAKFLFREHIGWHRLAAIGIGFIGIILLAQPQFSDPNIGYLLTFLAVFIIAAHVLTVRRIAGKDPLPLLSFYPGLGMIIVGGPMLLALPQMPAIAHLPEFLLYAVTLFIGQICFAMAFARTPITAVVAPFVYSQMLWGIFYGYIVFHHVPGITTIIGAAIVMGAGLFMILMDARIQRPRLLGAGRKGGSPAIPPAAPPRDENA